MVSGSFRYWVDLPSSVIDWHPLIVSSWDVPAGWASPVALLSWKSLVLTCYSSSPNYDLDFFSIPTSLPRRLH